MKFNPHEIIPPAYVGREQAYIKHLLLHAYLERLLHIVGWSASNLGHEEIVFIDCFAGPWKDESDDLTSTSISISMRLLSKVQYALEEVGRRVRFRAIYVEKDDCAFSRLHQFLSKKSPSNVGTKAIHGDFTKCIPDILSSCSPNSFAFFFVDPKGWLTVKPEVLQPLLARPRSEFLINFMYDFVNRAVSMDSQRGEIAALFDGHVDSDKLPNSSVQREQFLIERYRTAIVDRASTPGTKALSGYVTILDPTSDRTKYHLVYLTRHPKGIIEFMTQSEKLAGVQAAVRTAAKFSKKNRENSTSDLFGIDATQVELNSGGTDERLDGLKALWVSQVKSQPLSVTESVFANLICQSNCFPSELQSSLRDLIERGEVCNIDADIRRRLKYVVNYEKGERIERRVQL